MAPSTDINHLSHPWDYVSSHPERKSGFMKWLSKLFKGGSNRGRSGRHLHDPSEENLSWRAPSRALDDRARAQKEKEDLGHAMSLSSAEDMKRPNAHQGYRWGEENDEDYGKSLHDNFSSSAHPPYAPAPFYPTEYRRICGGCNQDIIYGNCLGCMDTYFHPDCFRCHSCRYPITEREPRNIKYYRLEDGRSLCLECMESAIMDTGDCQPLYHSIRDYYEGMHMRIDQQVPMLLVEREALNDAIVGEKSGFHHLPETRGLCLSEEQTVTSIHRRPRIGGHRLIGMRTQPQKLTRKCEVTAILVLYGLPRLLTGAILAHELMHAWLRLKGYRNLNPEVEEGICQVLSYMWLESEVMPTNSNSMPSTSTAASSSSSSSSSKKGAQSHVENKLGEFFKYQIFNDSSPAYGGGFRAANEAVNKYGLRSTLDHIRLTGFFPV
ncbi:hypothetical protein TSUD_247620 [Trifolium subterraneum]|uniref:LIM zinc-binding domain-containing protein n=1 Tax=Trifolium subterraneum TaxID=3900 RepID=A0A2Z6NZQ4_TRISU|nr:hypothetical protein TSUD_247620 [Trifolium subterraneum]